MDTTEKILGWMETQVRNEEVIDPHKWVEAGASLNILLGKETDLLFDLQQEVAKVKIGYIEGGDSVAKAKVKTEASDAYKVAKKQEAKIERITEAVRMSKVMARLKDGEYRGY